MLRNIIGPVFNLYKCVFLFLLVFFIPSFCKEKEIFENKKKTNFLLIESKNWTSFNSTVAIQLTCYRGSFRHLVTESLSTSILAFVTCFVEHLL